MLESVGFEWGKFQFEPVEHHLAHASSAYHLSGFKEKIAIMGIDGKGEYATTFFGYGENGRIHKIKEFYDPDSLGGLYGAITEFLGFDMLDGEYKVMGMAPYGDPNKYDFSRLIKCDGKNFQVNTKLVNVIGLRRYKEKGRGFYFTPKLLEWLGPRRKGDVADDPYVPGTHGVWPTGAGRAQHSRLPQLSRHRRPHQPAGQIPGTLASILPQHAGAYGQRDVQDRSPRTLYDLYL